jgi:hypothetical protein
VERRGHPRDARVLARRRKGSSDCARRVRRPGATSRA